MAHEIKETPVLRGIDAENFVRNFYAKKKTSEKKIKQMKNNVAYLKSIATFDF